MSDAARHIDRDYATKADVADLRGELRIGLGDLKADHARLEGKIDVVNEKIDGVKGAGKVALYILVPIAVATLGCIGTIVAALL